MENQKKNIKIYDSLYRRVSIEGILQKLENIDVFLDDATKTDTSWVGLYKNDFRDAVPGKKVLELGCGDCTNAAIMACLGAEVYANDISKVSGEIAKKLNETYDFPIPIKFIEGDFLKVDFPNIEFDFVVGKGFLHHLTHEVERKFMERITILLAKNGEARFLEPAVNSLLLDKIRWMLPVPGRPSKLNKKAFAQWKEKDAHPDRDNSSRHFRTLGGEFFKEVEILHLGALERFHRLLPQKNQRKFRRKAFLFEKYLPWFLNHTFARTQVIIYKKPI